MFYLKTAKKTRAVLTDYTAERILSNMKPLLKRGKAPWPNKGNEKILMSLMTFLVDWSKVGDAVLKGCTEILDSLEGRSVPVSWLAWMGWRWVEVEEMHLLFHILSWWTKGILHTLLRHPFLVLNHPFLRPSPHVHIQPAAIDQVYRNWGDYITIFILSIVLCCHLPQILAAIFLCLGFLWIRHVLFLQFGDWSCGGLMVCQSWQGGYPAVPLRQARWCRKLLLEQAANK